MGLKGQKDLFCPLAVPKIAFRLGAPRDFDRCASPHSLPLPPAAVARLTRHAPRASGSRYFSLPKKRRRDGFTCRRTCFALLRCPKSRSGLERRAILTATLRLTPSPCHRQRSLGSPGTLRVPRVRSITLCQKKGAVRRLLFWQGQKDLKGIRDFSCCDTQSVIQYAVLHSTCNNKIRTRYHKTTRNEKRFWYKFWYKFLY